MSGTTNRVQLAAAFAAIYLLWGGTYLAIALGLQSIPPFLLVGSRSILAGAVLFAFSPLRGLVVRPWRDWSHAAISGVLLFVGCHGALAHAQRFVPSGLVPAKYALHRRHREAMLMRLSGGAWGFR